MTALQKTLPIAISAVLCMAQPVLAQRSPDIVQGDRSAARPKYTLSVLDSVSGSTHTVAAAINNVGQVAGMAYDNGACASYGCPAIWNESTPTLLDTASEVMQTSVFGINDHGQVVGSGTLKTAGEHPDVGVHYPVEAIVWNGVKPTILTSLPSGWSSVATGINEKGQIAGFSFEGNTSHGVIWNGTKSSTLATKSCSYNTVINESHQVACTPYLEEGAVVLIEDHATKVLPTLGGDSNFASAINRSGEIVGFSSTSDGSIPLAAYWHGDKIRKLQSIAEQGSVAEAINAEGHIVGYDTDTAGESYAVYWHESTSEVVDLNSEISSQDAEEFMLSEAVGINDRCQIVAVGFHKSTGTSQSYVLSLNPGWVCH